MATKTRTKICTYCQQEKRLSCFPKKKKETGGVRYLSRCKPCVNAIVGSPEYRRKQREYRFRNNFGIDIATYERMAKQQGRLCAICGKDDRKLRNRLAVDHCHKTGKVRGLLCNQCNLALGAFQDDPMILEAAKQYLFKTSQ
jgi:hypothetical protein